MDLRPVLFTLGILVAALGASMVVPAVVDFIRHDFDWQAFMIASAVTASAGMSLVFSCRPEGIAVLSVRQTFLLTALSWIVLAAFAALPLAFSNLPMSFTDAYFEAMSGLTTTGSTILVGLDSAPIGILLWRAVLQWVGGIGIIVMAVTVLPSLRIGGMQLFRTESSDRTEKVLPRISAITGGIVSVYAGLTGLCAICLWLAGMTPFEAVTHSMTTLSTGGFSTSDASIGKFNSVAIEAIIVLFMMAGGITFTLYLRVFWGDPQALWRNSQVRWFFGLVIVCVAALSAWLIFVDQVAPFAALRHALFNVVSIITTTGFASVDYGQWGSFAIVLFYFLTFLGGCTGSTTGGLKIFRLQVLQTLAVAQIRRALHPHEVIQPVYDDRPLTDRIGLSVMGFFFLYGLCFIGLALLLGLTGLDLITCISGAATAIANVGPGLGEIIGPAGNFATLPDFAKWVMAGGMLLGRLELVTLLVLFHPSFWRG